MPQMHNPSAGVMPSVLHAGGAHGIHSTSRKLLSQHGVLIAMYLNCTPGAATSTPAPSKQESLGLLTMYWSVQEPLGPWL